VDEYTQKWVARSVREQQFYQIMSNVSALRRGDPPMYPDMLPQAKELIHRAVAMTLLRVVVAAAAGFIACIAMIVLFGHVMHWTAVAIPIAVVIGIACGALTSVTVDLVDGQRVRRRYLDGK